MVPLKFEKRNFHFEARSLFIHKLKCGVTFFTFTTPFAVLGGVESCQDGWTLMGVYSPPLILPGGEFTSYSPILHASDPNKESSNFIYKNLKRANMLKAIWRLTLNIFTKINIPLFISVHCDAL